MDRVEFAEIFIRQAYPGFGVEAYRSFERKLEDARRYKELHHLPWRVCVDDPAGTVHQAYGGMPNPCYILNAEGRVALYGKWAHAPTAHAALEQLIRDGSCVARVSIDAMPHLLAPLVNGWPAIERGLPQSGSDLMRTIPGMSVLLRQAYRFHAQASSVVNRSRPMPQVVRFGLALFLLAAVASGGKGTHRRRNRK